MITRIEFDPTNAEERARVRDLLAAFDSVLARSAPVERIPREVGSEEHAAAASQPEKETPAPAAEPEKRRPGRPRKTEKAPEAEAPKAAEPAQTEPAKAAALIGAAIAETRADMAAAPAQVDPTPAERAAEELRQEKQRAGEPVENAKPAETDAPAADNLADLIDPPAPAAAFVPPVLPPQATKESVRAAIVKIGQTPGLGRERAVAIMREFGKSETFPGINPLLYNSVQKACAEALAEKGLVL